MRKKIGIGLIVLGSTLSLAYGQKPPTPKPTVTAIPQDASKPKEGYADLDIEDPKVNQKTGITTGRSFVYREKDTVITGQKVQYNENEKRLLAEGNLVLDDPKHHVVGDKADVDNSKKKLAIITGVVIITLKPKPEMPPANGTVPTAPVTPPDGMKDNSSESAAKVRGRGVVISCDRAESYYSKSRKYVIMRGKEVRFTQKLTKKDGKEVERVVISEHAEYDGIKDTLLLFAPVKATDTDGQVMNFSQNVIVGTKEGDETLESKGKVIAIIKIDDEEDTQEKPKPPQKNPPR